MPFRFSLQALLHLRLSLEHQQELRLRYAHQQVARARRGIEQLEERIYQIRMTRHQQMAAGMTSAELSFVLSSEAACHTMVWNLERELSRLQSLRDQEQRKYQYARRERETLESLRDQHAQEYQLEQSRHEQRRLDDFFLLRKLALKHGEILPPR